jgi:hypothetical protein
MDVPNVQPPLPSDWEVHPTHPVHHVQYHLAQFWDLGMAQRAEERRRQNARKVQPAASARASTAPGRVPRELRDTAKRSPAVRGWVKVLEEPVRKFLTDGEREKREEKEVSDSEDDEIVFVGRGGASTLEGPEWKRARREVREKPVETGMVLDSVGEDEQSSAFKYAFLTVTRGDSWMTDTLAGDGLRILSRTTTGLSRGHYLSVIQSDGSCMLALETWRRELRGRLGWSCRDRSGSYVERDISRR